LKQQFLVPQVAIRVWGVAGSYAEHAFAKGVSEESRAFASSLSTPYCGINTGFEAASWLDDAGAVASMAMIPLRLAVDGDVFGLLVLASPDPTRYTLDMGTDFLNRIGDVASCGLSRLRPVEATA